MPTSHRERTSSEGKNRLPFETGYHPHFSMEVLTNNSFMFRQGGLGCPCGNPRAIWAAAFLRSVTSGVRLRVRLPLGALAMLHSKVRPATTRARWSKWSAIVPWSPPLVVACQDTLKAQRHPIIPHDGPAQLSFVKVALADVGGAVGGGKKEAALESGAQLGQRLLGIEG